MESTPLYHFMPSSTTWSFEAPGSNFSASEILSQSKGPMHHSGAELTFTTPEQIVSNAIREGCSSVSCTGTEPALLSEYALEVMKHARRSGLMNIWSSNGYLSKNCLDAIHPWLDAITIDLHSMEDAWYRRMYLARLEPVLDTLRLVSRSDIHLEITSRIIPGYSEKPEILERLAGFIAHDLGKETPWHLIPFTPGISQEIPGTPAISSEKLDIAMKIGLKAGLSFIYEAHSHSDTLCPQCGAMLVKRENAFRSWRIVRFDTGGHCPDCNALSPIPDSTLNKKSL
ncbi:MAG: AmmeMemoRadiSam system radical SAM enzyme [Chlorobiaceae bacterium]|nr:AmmeMemoRadiSam system radical SAM enzyme [Chlorobiaceae bacterium]